MSCREQATVEEFRSLFSPEFDDPILTDAEVQTYLDQAYEIFGCSKNSQLYLAAHLAALDIAESGQVPEEGSNTSGTGAITQKKVGDISVKFADVKEGDEDYMRTKYGRRFVKFRDASIRRQFTPQVFR